jgi:hypothetical protein
LGAPRRERQFFLEQRCSQRRGDDARGAARSEQQVIRINRLGEKVERALSHRRHGVLKAAERRHHDDRISGSVSLRGRSTPRAVAFRQAQIRQHDPGTARSQQLDRFRLVAALDDGVALRFERVAQHHAKRIFVLDDEDGG